MDCIKNYADLIVWKKSMDMATLTYNLTKKLPKDEGYNLISQMRRCAVSIPSNIAEGQQRQSSKEFVRFLAIARGSNGELETQFLLCSRFGYLTEDESKNAIDLLSENWKNA